MNIIDGKLVNVGSDIVRGRFLFNDSSIDPSEYDIKVFVLNPVYGNTQSVYQYGSFNYQIHYYLSRSGSYDRIVSDNTYGDFYVTDTHIYWSSSDRSYYALFIIIFMLGGVYICLRRTA